MAPGTFGIVVLANNCRDDTVAATRAALGGSGIPRLVIDERFAPPLANVGFARGVALELAAHWLEHRPLRDGVILTTDADSRVPQDWLVRNMAALAAGCGGVAGRVRLLHDMAGGIGPALERRGVLEDAYEQALLRLQAHIDPIAHDPWPNHWAASGASLALSLDAYRTIGGLPMIPCGEDRALSGALQRHDIAIRHDPRLVVDTSARLDGRAEGGVADALRLRMQTPDMPGDNRLEPLPHALRRFIWRARLRRLHMMDALGRGDWIAPLGLPASAREWGGRYFGAFWQRLEVASPVLAYDALRPSQMPANTRAAHAMLRDLDDTAFSRGPDSPTDTRLPASVEPSGRDVARAC